MEPTSTASTKAARWFLGALTAVNLCRAITQPVTPGEAWNYDRFIGGTWAEGFSRFDINNHVINTLLVRISTAAFHLTELSLRLPSLLAGLFYLWAAYRIARRWFPAGFPFLAVLGLLTLNPLVVDALSEARGYGMALACWMWALELILESLQRYSPQKLNLSAICLGLSVAASLAFAAPAIALLTVAVMWLGRSPHPAARPRWTLPAIAFLTAFVLLAIPLNRADWGTLATGATSLRKTINEIITLSTGTSSKLLAAAGRVALAIAALAGAACAVRFWRQAEGALAALSGATLALTLVILVAAHRCLHAPFPQAGAVYLIPITVLTVTAIILKHCRRPAQIALLFASALLLLCYASRFPFGAYAAGSQFSGGRIVAKSLRAIVGRSPVRVATSLAAEPIVRYYRLRYGQSNWQLVPSQPLTGNYNYYILTPADAALIDQRHLHVIYRDAGLVLAQ